MVGKRPPNEPRPLGATEAERCGARARAIAAGPADRYLSELLGHSLGGTRGEWIESEIATLLDDPVGCLRAVYGRYAFARRGKERKALADLATGALDAALSDGRPLANLSIEDVWRNYCEASEAAGRKAAPDLNRGVVVGLAGFAQAIAQESGTSLARYAADCAKETGRIESVFFDIVELRGVGPKVAATMLRDWIFVFGVEERVAHRDSIYLQPIDRWMRAAAPYLLEDTGSDAFPDWILAGKLGKAARAAGVSGIRLNMGVCWLGLEASAHPAPEGRFLELLGRLTPH
ncbi:MAG TPA: hypothetical protein VKT78_03620 [Fimbriimonadaceae bacterium]|nr:hypothetical protein [Fimbriimonadaceae bacterium]